MMKFRGLTLVGLWVYGDLLTGFKDFENRIRDGNIFAVRNGTVGFTMGSKDKKGNVVYTGDIVAMRSDVDLDSGGFSQIYIGEVVMIPSMGLCLKTPYVIEKDVPPHWVPWIHSAYKKLTLRRSVKIGNIHEHTDLMMRYVHKKGEGLW